MTLQLLHSEFPYIWGKFVLFFISEVPFLWLPTENETNDVGKGALKSGETIIFEMQLSLLNCVQHRVHSGTGFRGPDTTFRNE